MADEYEQLQEEIIRNPTLADNQGFRLFGFEIRRSKKKQKEQDKINRQTISLVDPDGSELAIGPFGGLHSPYHTTAYGLQNSADPAELIKMYRRAAEHPEADTAIEDIMNESIVGNDKEGSPVNIVVDNVPGTQQIRDTLTEEFEHIIQLLNFNQQCYRIFREWYIDGHLYYHIILDPDDPKTHGIIGLQQIDSVNIRRVRDVILKPDRESSIDVVERVDDYFQYSNHAGQEIRIAADSIAYVNSGVFDSNKRMVHSYLHKALKPINQLRILEDSLVIYRLARAPERRAFYIDVGNLPKNKAEEYLNRIMARHRNSLNYNHETGELVDRKNHLAMVEDYWLPRREGGRGTEIDTLSGGDNLGEIEDIEYFRQKLYKSLNVPITRLEQEMEFSLGRNTEITREELKFQKFINRLRQQFSNLFFDLLRKQMLVKELCDEDDWEIYKEKINFDFRADVHFSEMKESELLQERASIMSDLEDYIGNYFSKTWVRKNVLKLTEEEIERMKDEINTEKAEEPDDDSGGGRW